LKKVAIIGAGISGLSIAKLLADSFECEILESEEDIGGIARTKSVNEVPYHTVGGHCFNSKNQDVMDFVFNSVLTKEKWNLFQRSADINFCNNIIAYPIEFSIKNIYQFDKELAFNITNDFLNANVNGPKNLEEWFIQNFGETLSRKYFIPYNKKIWQMDPKNMSYSWVEGKLPLPDKKSFFNALMDQEKDSMPHSKFYYPKSNNQNTFIDALADKLNIITNYKVKKIEKINDKWLINNEKIYDIVISTMPLDKIPVALNAPAEILEEAKKLKYNKVTNVLWERKALNSTWTYYPEDNTIFHRHIHIGNFLHPKKNYTITESMGEHTFEEMKKYGEKVNYLIEPIDYNVSDYAYPVFDQNYQKSTGKIKMYLEEKGIYTLGRFGEWNYYNMDICIEKAMELSKKLKNKEGVQ